MKSNKKAFTLIELLVVVLIIGILAAIALPQYQKTVAKSRYQQLIVTGNAIRDAEERYYLANDEYTNNLDDLDIKINNNPNIYIIVTDGKNSYARVSLQRGNSAYVVAFSNDYFEANQKDCLARKSDNLAIKVCMEITGTTTLSDWAHDTYRFKFK
jgi:prepilin-type N-terminal cleavage/methylation domain-containing protein